MTKQALPILFHAIVREGNAGLRLVAVTSECPRQCRLHGRDLMADRRIIVRARDVIARHDDYLHAVDCFRAARRAAAASQEALSRAWAAYARAQRQHEKALSEAAEGKAVARKAA
jgi:hypothetical protein